MLLSLVPSCVSAKNESAFYGGKQKNCFKHFWGHVNKPPHFSLCCGDNVSDTRPGRARPQS